MSLRRQRSFSKAVTAMCLGIPGRVVALYHEHDLLMGKIDFGGVRKEACLATVPDAAIGDYVLIHVGFALAKIDEAEARRVFSYLEQMDELGELGPASDSIDRPVDETPPHVGRAPHRGGDS